MPAPGGVKYRLTRTSSGEQKLAMDGDDDHQIVPPPDQGSKIAGSRRPKKQYPYAMHYMSTSSMPLRVMPMVSSASGTHKTSSNVPWVTPEIMGRQSLTSSRVSKKATVAPAPMTFPPPAHHKSIPSSTSASAASISRSMVIEDYFESYHLQRDARKGGASDETWRKYGKLLRANLVLNDEQNGGNSFTLNDSCTIDRYYRVADRVRCCVDMPCPVIDGAP
jgi:hypothetical protein